MKSMTGYGRCHIEEDGREMTVEVKSVNHRFLDISYRLSRTLSFLDDAVRKGVGARLARGHVDVFVSYANHRQDAKEVRVDTSLAVAYQKALCELAAALGKDANVPLSDYTRLPDVLTVQEKEWAAQMQAESIRLGIEEKSGESEKTEERKLTAEEKRSLLFILLSIVLWFFGYNAVTSKYSVYASNILHKDYNLTLIIAQAAAIVSYLPVGIIASKVGRKKTIMAGVVMLATAFAAAAFVRANSPNAVMIALFALAGIAWATINVNSFPMVVELCSGGNVGKYTGFYYTASMAAQVATPMLSGLLMDKLGMTVLFPYAAIFVALAFVTMRQVRHGDSKPEAKKGLDAIEGAED